MAGRVRRRTSKWDVAAEHHVGTESLRHESAVPAEVDESCKLTELNHTNNDCGKPLEHYETKPSVVDGSEIDQSADQSGQVKNSNVVLSDDFCERSQYSKQVDLVSNNKDGLKIQDQDISQDPTMTEYTQNQDKPLKVTNAMSPGPDERGHLSRDASPTAGRAKFGRKRSRSRSLSYDSRSRSWSRSPSYASKQGFERWSDKGRMKGAVEPCRDFTAGRCRRGSECRYLHEGGGWRQTNRHHDAGPTIERETRFERGRHIGYESKENFTNSREKVSYSRETLSKRHENPYDDGWDNNKQHKGYRSNEICFDFTKGRCHRGMSCRYIHHNASSDDRCSVRDESRGRLVDRRDGGASFVHRLERQRVSDVRCKYFLEGRCRHGEGCRFSHQLRPLNNPEDKSHDSQHRLSVGDSTLAKASEQHDQSTQFGITNHLLAGGENELRVSDAQHLGSNDLTNRSLFDRSATLNQASHKETQPSEQQTTEQKATEQFSATLIIEGQNKEEMQADLGFAHNPHSTTSIASQNVDHNVPSQIAPQLMSAQNFASNSPVGQFTPPLPLNGQMQAMQAMHSFRQSGQNQLATPHKPSDAHYFNAIMQNQSAHLPHYELNQQKLDYGGQVQRNLPLLHGESNYNLTGQIEQNLSLIHNALSQPNFTIGGKVQHSLSSHVGNNHQNIVVGDAQKTLPQNVQMQEPSVPLLIPNGQRQFLAQLPSNPQSFKSDDRNSQVTSNDNSNSQQQPIQSGEEKPQGGADSSEVKSSVFTSDNPITHKVVTTEQAAKIIDLSASLAQFFGTAALNSQSTAGMNQALINPGSLDPYVNAVGPIPAEVGGSQTNLNHSAPSTVTMEEKPHQQIHVMEHIKQGEDASAKEVEKIETLQNKEQLLQIGDAEDTKDGDSKKMKEAKGVRMFKCALVEFVKDILKPTWKEGQLSKEAHKTIVKKVVDKVSGSLQGPNVPQTQEKIDLYLANSKPKLSKLVQAYVEKYIKS